MHIEPTSFDGLFVITPRVFSDDRGYFFEAYNREVLAASGIPDAFVQDNQSGSVANVLRGLHFQLPPHGQGKLVRVLRGAVLDVAVDLRRNQPTFGKHFRMRLDAETRTMLFIPEGFAHGFRTLEDDTIFFYKCTRAYNRAAERAIRWNDPALGIDWGTDAPVLSEKDKMAMPFGDFDSPF